MNRRTVLKDGLADEKIIITPNDAFFVRYHLADVPLDIGDADVGKIVDLPGHDLLTLPP
ncbi:hypothetical protein [Bradyrhizobium sp. SYSU BS000235]|uniref:hypothetical protein n=1 Tax=Bradyrhizobium sp. SYSU BS000235 TaxID=3411332 RepID=UPI003C753728